MICDEVKIRCFGGRGGDGSASFRRAKYVPRGGPDGGNGGRGGDVIIVAHNNVHTLSALNQQKNWRAANGNPGQKEDCNGRNGADLTIQVPTGTLVYTVHAGKKTLVADLAHEHDRTVICKGGMGGRGNTHFKSSTFQAPTFAEYGEAGEEKDVMLELKLIADVGIIGLPSSGKSTLLNAVTNAKAKTAAYHFTTLSPNLGIVDIGKYVGDKNASFILADIPGLIEGAHAGKGLGHEFLKHVQRTKVLLHIIDATDPDPKKSYKTINVELKKYDPALAKKPQIIAINKMDAIPDDEREETIKAIKKTFRAAHPWFISAITQENVIPVMKQLYQLLQDETKKTETPEQTSGNTAAKTSQPAHKIFRPHLDNNNDYTIKLLKTENKKRYYEITGDHIEKLIKRHDVRNPQAVTHLYHYFNKMGIAKKFAQLKARKGDIMVIAGRELPIPHTEEKESQQRLFNHISLNRKRHKAHRRSR